eukprot:symbB.v1.2.010101.t1/scaffold656.1/size175949/3
MGKFPQLVSSALARAVRCTNRHGDDRSSPGVCESHRKQKKHSRKVARSKATAMKLHMSNEDSIPTDSCAFFFFGSSLSLSQSFSSVPAKWWLDKLDHVALEMLAR